MERSPSLLPLAKKIALSAVFLGALFSGTARAQLFLEEGKVVLSVSGGQRVNKSLVVHNTSDKEINVKVYWEDFEYKPPYDGNKVFQPAGTLPNSAGPWVSFLPQTFKLPAKGKQRVDYSISVPDSIERGHYGVLFFEQAGPSMKTQAGISIVTRVGCLFFLEPKNKSKQSTVSSMTIKGAELSGKFSNAGNVTLIPRMTYNIMDKEGLVADRGEVKKLYVPPGASAVWAVTLNQKLGPGGYTLLLNVDLDEGDVIVKEIQLLKNSSGQYKIQNVRD